MATVRRKNLHRQRQQEQGEPVWAMAAALAPLVAAWWLWTAVLAVRG